MRKRDKELWVKALRSGNYKQVDGSLAEIVNGQECNCCLGVACRVFNVERGIDGDEITYGGEDALLPNTLQERLGLGGAGILPKPVTLSGRRFSSLVEMNDSGISFDVIATIIEQQF